MVKLQTLGDANVSAHSNWWKMHLTWQSGESLREGREKKEIIKSMYEWRHAWLAPGCTCEEVTQGIIAKALRTEWQSKRCHILIQPLAGAWRGKSTQHQQTLSKLSHWWSHCHRKSDGTHIQKLPGWLPAEMKLGTSPQRTWRRPRVSKQRFTISRIAFQFQVRGNKHVLPIFSH